MSNEDFRMNAYKKSLLTASKKWPDREFSFWCAAPPKKETVDYHTIFSYDDGELQHAISLGSLLERLSEEVKNFSTDYSSFNLNDISVLDKIYLEYSRFGNNDSELHVQFKIVKVNNFYEQEKEIYDQVQQQHDQAVENNKKKEQKQAAVDRIKVLQTELEWLQKQLKDNS